jgi:CRP/FNR family transcriptional regulator, cyclic AMP receptor protein
MSIVRLLQVDPDLGERLPPDERERARELVRLRVIRAPRGTWDPPAIDHGATGLFLISGLLVRQITLGTVSSTEVVGPSDIIRPWEDELIPNIAAPSAKWRVIEDLQLGLIDAQATAQIGRWPELSAAISGRLLRRTRALSYLMAAQHFLRVEDRLLATLWHLAGMWGRVTPQGTVVPFRLTHDTLAGIIGAQRPTTTTAIRSLTEQGKIARDEHRFYVLLDYPPRWEKVRLPAASLET